MGKKRVDQGDMFAAPPPAPVLPPVDPVREAVIVFMLRHQGRQFDPPALSASVRAAVPGAPFAAPKEALDKLVAEGKVEVDRIAPNLYRVVKVKP
jgi:hypothetical protein